MALLWATGWPILVLLAAAWYLDLCLTLGHRPIHGFWFLEQFVRETLFCLTLVLLLPWPALLLCFAITFVFVPAAVFYQKVFSTPLSFTTILHQWKEGSESFSWEFARAIPDVP